MKFLGLYTWQNKVEFNLIGYAAVMETWLVFADVSVSLSDS